MDLSVCIVSYNCRDLLRQCLLSIERTAVSLAHEIIVVDNASGDGTVGMLAAEFPHVVCVANEDNPGFAGGTNQAMARARGATLLMLNPDTEVQPGALEALVGFLGERAWVGAVGPRLIGSDGGVQATCHPFPTLARTLVRQLGAPAPKGMDFVAFLRERAG